MTKTNETTKEILAYLNGKKQITITMKEVEAYAKWDGTNANAVADMLELAGIEIIEEAAAQNETPETPEKSTIKIYTGTTSNGIKVSRKSERVYTHAVVTPCGLVYGFCGTFQLAQKKLSTDLWKAESVGKTLEIIEVKATL